MQPAGSERQIENSNLNQDLSPISNLSKIFSNLNVRDGPDIHVFKNSKDELKLCNNRENLNFPCKNFEDDNSFHCHVKLKSRNSSLKDGKTVFLLSDDLSSVPKTEVLCEMVENSLHGRRDADFIISKNTNKEFLEKKDEYSDSKGEASLNFDTLSKLSLPRYENENFRGLNCYQSFNFYGVYLPEATGSLLVSKDLKDVLKILKKCPLARFKGFVTKEDAIKFCQQQDQSTETQVASSISCLNAVTSPLKSVSSQDCRNFRIAIEEGNVTYFNNAVWQNARILVTNGDTPRILKEGFRYNALHIAVRSNKPKICQAILNAINDVNFYTYIFDTAPKENCQQIMHNIVDLFINSPDKRLGETPLHFASKFGHLECVQILLNHPLCDSKLKNICNESAEQIICTRISPSPEKLTQEIQKLFNEYMFVPVKRAKDLPPRIERPCRHYEVIKSMSCETQTDKSNYVVKAYAGPMSEVTANRFYAAWKKPLSPSNCDFVPHDKNIISQAQIKDTQKGLERIGRALAQHLNISWSEYWIPLNKFADLSSLEGMTILENHLITQQRKTGFSNSDIYSDKLSVSEDENDFETPPSSPVEIFSTPPTSPVWFKDSFDDVFVLGCEFSRHDADMFIAVSRNTEYDESDFPHICHWKSVVQRKLNACNNFIFLEKY